MADLVQVHLVRAVEADHVLAQNDGIVHRGQAEAASGLHGACLVDLLTLVDPWAERLQLRNGTSQLNRDRIRQRSVDDVNNTIVIFCQMIQEHCVSNQTFVICHASSLYGDALQEILLIHEIDQVKALFDDTLDSSTIRTNIAKQFGKISGLEDELSQGLVAHRRLGLAESARKIRIETDQGEVINSGFNVSSTELSRVLGNEISEINLGVLFHRERHCTKNKIQN